MSAGMVGPDIAEGLLRGIALGALIVSGGCIGAAALRAPTPARWTAAAFALAAAGHVLDNWNALRGTAIHASVPTWILSALGPGLFWAFAITVFDDRFGWPLIAIPTLSLVLSMLADMVPGRANELDFAYNLLAGGLVAHALIVVWRGWRGDLVESRRRLRALILGATGLYILAIAAGNLSSAMPVEPSAVPQAAILAALSAICAIALLRPDLALVGGTVADRKAPSLAGADRLALERLQAAMEGEQVWRREDLSIGGLAAELNLPEHRLRHLINRQLGFRNFSTFINASRIAGAKSALADLQQARKSIAAIAFEHGFGSLGPFNRAFKDATGITPGAWRQRGLAESEDSRADSKKAP